MSECPYCTNTFEMNDTCADEFRMWQGLQGPYYIPSVDAEGNLSWTNTGDLPNPNTVNIRGQSGTGLTIGGIVEDVESLPETAENGVTWLVGDSSPYEGYAFVNGEWLDIGELSVGPKGDPGDPGADGVGVPSGGTTGQVLAKASGTDYDTEWVDQSGGGGTPGSQTPAMDGTAAVGVSSAFAREDHVHPTDTSRAAAADLTALETAVGDVSDLSGFTATDLTGAANELKTAISHAVLDNESQLRTASQKIQVYSNIFGESASAGFHNSIYRGKYLGNSFTADQHTAISNGTFDDLFIGDYWTIGGIDYVICHFDYYYECSDAEITFHHVVVMPRGVMTGLSVTKTSSETTDGYYQWNTSNTVTGGYVASRMRTAIMPACDTKVKAAFGSSYVKTISELYPTAHDSSSGRATGWGWTTTDLACDLCNETMVCGHQVWSISNDGRPGYEVGIDKWQLAIFALCPEFANIRAAWWLRSVASATDVACVGGVGTAGGNGASSAYGVRPRFLLS